MHSVLCYTIPARCFHEPTPWVAHRPEEGSLDTAHTRPPPLRLCTQDDAELAYERKEREGQEKKIAALTEVLRARSAQVCVCGWVGEWVGLGWGGRLYERTQWSLI
jgi:hypothetical protein